ARGRAAAGAGSWPAAAAARRRREVLLRAPEPLGSDHVLAGQLLVPGREPVPAGPVEPAAVGVPAAAGDHDLLLPDLPAGQRVHPGLQPARAPAADAVLAARGLPGR